MNHAQAGDPAKLGRVLVELGSKDSPPVNLPVGPDAVAYVIEHHQHVLDEINA
jgi:hypothetical protein